MIFKVKTLNGIAVNIEASTHQEARMRAMSPDISRAFARMIQESLNQIVSIEPLRGPRHLIKSPVFDEAFFNNLKL